MYAMSVGLGCMRLSAVEEMRATEVLRAARDVGVRIFDTADVYAPAFDRIGHNERLVAAAFPVGERPEIATKGGLTRPAAGVRWVPDGRARHLEAACAASLERLGAIDLYQLHAVDPRTPLATSVRALAALRKAKVVRAIGLCNV